MLLPPAARRPGAVTFWIVLCLGVIVGVVALGMDGGRIMDERRRAQAAADAAALAAAADLYSYYPGYKGVDTPGSAAKAAGAIAAVNGYANDGRASVVTVNIPPQSGPFKGQAGYAEVLIRSTIPAGFGAVFTSGGLHVTARAVARGQPRPVGVLLLAGSADGALSLSGNAAVTVAKGSLVIDSSSATALQGSDNASVSAPAVDITGGYSGTGFGSNVRTNVPATADPLQALAASDPSQYVVQSTTAVGVSGNSSAVLHPGVYQGGITVSGNGSLTLLPGVYVLQGGGFQVSGNGAVTGSGVMIDNTTGAGQCPTDAGPISISGNGSINLTPPTSGPYSGIGFFQDRSVSATIQLSGNGSMQMPGVVYAPAAAVEMSGNAGADSIQGGGFIVATMTAWGNAAVNVNPLNNYVKVPDVRLVE